MKTFKESVCLLLVLAMSLTATACRRMRSNESSDLSDIYSRITINDTESADGSSDAATSSGGASSGNKKPQTSTSGTQGGTSAPAASTTQDYPIFAMDKLPNFSHKEFDISGFWAPYEISEESFKTYKGAGFTTLAMINHNGAQTSDNQFYLGSNRTQKSLELCRKVGLKAILSYNDWIAICSSGNKNYYSGTPFSQYDIYGDYKDIITGIHIVDEPKKSSMDLYSAGAFINDFKNVYPNADFVVNLTPKYAGATPYEFVTYDQLVDYYGEHIMSKFNKSYISVDYYPFPQKGKSGYPRRQDMLLTYDIIANAAKKYNAVKTFILQSSAGCEFNDELTETDMRFQVNMALAYGADKLQHYCYSVPGGEYNYNYCVLTRDNKPSKLYYYLKNIHKEIQSYADVILSYDWVDSTAIAGNDFSINYDINSIKMKDLTVFEASKNYASATATADLAITRFENKEYGEAFMLVNYSEDHSKTNSVNLKLKGCRRVAVYGKNGFGGTPQIVNLESDGSFKTDLTYGEGCFLIPLA